MKLFSTDHKTIARRFLILSLSMFLTGGLVAMLMRWQLAYPGRPLPFIGEWFPQSMMVGGVMLPEFYAALFTTHATLMIFFGVIPLLVGAFGNYLIPLQIGAREMAFPRLSRLSFWLMIPAALILFAGFFTEDGLARTGWTAYAPLSIVETGQNLWIVSILFVGASSILGAVNQLVTILNMRAPGMSFFRMPLTVWSMLITAVITLLATPVLCVALLMLLADRVAGAHFFTSSGGGQPLLWQHLFWFYSHPAVYIMILPGMGMISDILSTHARKPVFGYKSMVLASASIAFLGFIVWGHHMFQSGMNPALGTTFMISTLVIAVPSGVKTFNWLGTLWRGSLRLTPPMLHALAFVSMFVIGGLSGVFLASTPVDMYVHDTYFVVAHIHYVLFGGTMFAIFAAVCHWYPKMYGREMSVRLAVIHFALTLVAFNLTFFPMHFLGMGGMMRRLYDTTQYAHLKPLQTLNVFISHSAFLLGASQIVFVVNFFGSMIWGKKAPANPWQANTLEWTVASPPTSGNFEKVPRVVRGPYEYSRPDSSKDWLSQDE